jgi:DNA-binding beta-propeller fold protein YncE
MAMILGRSQCCLPVLCVVVALFVTLQVQSGKAQQTRLLVGDAGKDGILVYDSETGAILDGWGLSPTGGLEAPTGLTFGPDDNLNDLYVSSEGSDSILRYNGQTGNFLGAFVASGSGGLDAPQGLIFGPNHDLYVSSEKTNSILRYDGQTGEFIKAFVVSGSGGLKAPQGLIFGPNHDLYVSSIDSDSILRYDGQTGDFIGAFVTQNSGGLTGPRSLTFGSDGNLYVSSLWANRILRYDGQTGDPGGVVVAPGSNDLDAPQGLIVGPDHHLYVSSFWTNSILRYDGQTGKFMNAFVTSGSGGLAGPRGLTFGPGPDGNLYVSSDTTNSILRYDGQTGKFINAFVTSGSGGLGSPQGLTFGPDGNLYVSSDTTNSILCYNGQTGAFINVFVMSGEGISELNGPRGLTFKPGEDQDLYVSSYWTNSILRYDGQTGAFLDAFVTSDNGELKTPVDLIFGPMGHLYVSSQNTHRILRYDGQTGASLNPFVSFAQGGLTFPTGLVFQTLEQPALPLRVVKDGEGRGDVFSSPEGIDCGDTCTSEFLDGTEITLTAVPQAEHRFLGWQGGGCAGTGPCTVTLTQPLTLTATFDPQPSIDHVRLAIVPAGTGSGHVTADSGMIDCGAVCTAEYVVGTSDTLRATPAADSVFVGWGGEGCSGVEPCTLTMDQLRTLTAVFEPLPEPDTFPLFVSKIGNGAGRVTSNSEVIDCGPRCRAEFTDGTSVALNAMSDPNSTFGGWQGGGCAGMSACTVSMTQEQSITARFDRVPMPKTLSVQKQGTGRGTVSSIPPGIDCGVECRVEFADNEVVTLSVEPASDSTFVGWAGGLCSGTAPCRVTMNDNRLVTALINSEEPPEVSPE